jgi:hypothetical protein
MTAWPVVTEPGRQISPSRLASQTLGHSDPTPKYELSSRPESTRISCHSARNKATCAPFRKRKAHSPSLGRALVTQRVGQPLQLDAKHQILPIVHILDTEDVNPVILVIRPVRNNRWILPISLE